MAIELEKINFTDYEEPSVSGETLNNMQEKMQTALNKAQEILTSGDNITIENNVISATGGGGFNLKTLYEDNTGNVSSKTANLIDDSWLNYKVLAFESCTASGAVYGWSFIVMDESINTNRKYQLHPLDNKDATASSGDVGSLRAIKIQFNSETQLTAYSRNWGGTDIWLTKIVGIY